MRANYPYLFLMLSLAITLVIMPVNAGEVSVTFDEGRLSAGQEIGNTYSDLGITFSPGVKLVDTGCLRSKKDRGFWNPDNRIIQIYFSPAASSVSIDFENAFSGNMDALLVNGKVHSKSEYNCVWSSKKTLKIESNNPNIKSISISGKSPCSKKIKFDNLCYEQVPEASEDSTCGNEANPDNTDNNCPDVPENPSCGNDSKTDDACPEIPENSSCGNDTKPDNPCNQQIPEYPTIALPMITVIGMMFIFQRRKN